MDFTDVFKYWFILFSFLQSSIACFPGVITSGVTSPSGNIEIVKGNTLTINCSINSNYTGPRTSKDIRWNYNNNENVDYRYVTILDERSAQLNIPNMNLSDKGKYACYLSSMGQIETSLCNNVVTVAGRLQKPLLKDFNCVSSELINMTCTWKTQNTGVNNTWSLRFQNNGGFTLCPQYIYDSNHEAYGCYFANDGVSRYVISIGTFTFTLDGKNSISNTTMTVKMKHYEHVIAPSPQTVVVYNSSGNELRVEWDENTNFQLYKIALVYRVAYKSEWDRNWTFVDVGSDTKCFLKNLIPNANYSVVVRSKVKIAEDVFEMWSQSVNVTRRVRSTAPTAIVQMSSSGFDDVNVDMSRRNITIFWKPLHQSEFKGSKFHYVVTAFSKNDSEIKNLTQIVFGQKFSATFNYLKHNKSYKFTVRAANDEGEAENAAEIHVAKKDDKLADVSVFRVISFGNGIYEVSWNATESPAVTGYVILYCKSSSTRPDLCLEAPEWTDVDPNIRQMNITLLDNEAHYGFAVSARGQNTSSGVVWAKCTTRYNGVVRKIKMKPLKAERPLQILVTWEIDCSEQYGIIDGFQIAYCVYDFQEAACKEKLEYRMTTNNHDTSYLLDGLKPNTNYSVSVTAKLNHNQIGEAGDPQFIKTNEAAPEHPPNDFAVVNVTNATITVEWTKSETQNGIITHYLIEYKRSKSPRPHRSTRFYVDFNDLSPKCVKVINGSEIKSYTNYSISIKACVGDDDQLCSNYSNPITALTPVGVPGEPVALSVNIVAANAVVQWNAPHDSRGPIDYYYLTIESAPKEEDSALTNYRTMIVNGTSQEVLLDCTLEPTYRFSVQAVNAFDGQELIGKINTKTLQDACSNVVSSALKSSLIACGTTIAIVLVLIGGYYLVKYVKIWKKKWGNVQVSLPNKLQKMVEDDFLKIDNPKMNGNGSLNNNYKSSISTISPSEESRCSASSQLSTETTMSTISETDDASILGTNESNVDPRYAFQSQQSKDSGHDSDSVSSRDSVFTTNAVDTEVTSEDHNVETYHIPHTTEKTNNELHLNPRSLTNPGNSEINSSMTNYSQVGLALPSNYVAVNNVAVASNMTKAPNTEVHAGYSRVGQMIPPNQPNETVPLNQPRVMVPPNQPNGTNRPDAGYVMAASLQTGFPNGQSNVRNNVYLDSRQFEPNKPEQGKGYVLVDSRQSGIAS